MIDYPGAVNVDIEGPESDVTTVSLTDETSTFIEGILMTKKYMFKEMGDAARFLMAVAIRANTPAGQVKNATTVWATETFDRSGEIRALMSALYPKARPVRQINFLIDEGAKIVRDFLDKNPGARLMSLVDELTPQCKKRLIS